MPPRRKPEILPTTGPIALDRLARAIAWAPSALKVPDTLSVKTVLVEVGDGDWTHFATVLRVGFAPTATGDDMVDRPAGRARLIAADMECESVTNGEQLREVLTTWRLLASAGPLDFQQTAMVNQWPSRNRWTPTPCWRAELHENAGRSAIALPPGPFLVVETAQYAPVLGSLAAEWLGDELFREANTVANAYVVILPDRRAFFETLEAEGNELRVQVRVSDRGTLNCGYEWRDFDGVSHTGATPVRGGGATIHFARAVRTLRLDLIGPDGDGRDQYQEGPGYGSWGQSLFNEDARVEDPGRVALRQALEQGEGQLVEFKSWIAVRPRDEKSREFLETAVAFANAQGGVLYIGVTDNAELDGVERWLRKVYGKRHGESVGKMRDAYVMDLRRILAEAVMPPIAPTFEWVHHGGLLLLRIVIPRGQDQPHYLIETNQFWVRKGATNRKAHREELREMFRRPR